MRKRKAAAPSCTSPAISRAANSPSPRLIIPSPLGRPHANPNLTVAPIQTLKATGTAAMDAGSWTQHTSLPCAPRRWHRPTVIQEMEAPPFSESLDSTRGESRAGDHARCQVGGRSGCEFSMCLLESNVFVCMMYILFYSTFERTTTRRVSCQNTELWKARELTST